MDSLSMEKAMLKNMVEKTGKPINEWIQIVKKTEFDKHSEKVSYLKENYSIISIFKIFRKFIYNQGVELLNC